MPSIIQLPTHIANLIAAGEVVERPASVVKELLENAVDAGATKITVEIRDGGMTFLRVTDDGCGMSPQDARTAFLRHATSKLRTAEDLAAISTMGFRGEALAAIASVSRIDLMTKPSGSLSGTSLHLEAGVITEESEAGCPEGTTIIIRDLFYNTPARMKFMKSDTVEAGRVTAAVQLQALAHPQVAISFLRDGKQVLSTPGGGELQAAVYCVYGREFAAMAQVQSKWDDYRLTGYVSKPTQARPSRNLQTFFVNNRPVKSRLLVSALEEAYRNQLMVGKFPACVLHLELPATAVDVNVHPAKTEVKFLNEKAVFDCVHYGVLAALNKTADRPAVQFPQSAPGAQSVSGAPQTGNYKPAAPQAANAKPAPRQDFYRTMTPEEFKTFSAALDHAPKPKPEAAAAAAALVQKAVKEQPVLRSPVAAPKMEPVAPPPLPDFPEEAPQPQAPEKPSEPVEPVQEELSLPAQPDWRMVGELYRTYILVEQGEDAFLIDKHAAHERILFEKLKSNQESISAQALLSPIPVRLNPTAAAELLANTDMLEELGFEIEEFGENTVLLRQIPMDLSPEDAAQAVEALSADLLCGRREHKDTVRDELLHTVACKAAIKAGWVSD
ncbi:MAG: DNA mismatch repair endonuclease MutL, partial [Faecousia sp.]